MAKQRKPHHKEHAAPGPHAPARQDQTGPEQQPPAGDLLVNSLLESLAEGVIGVDQSGAIVLFNRQAEAIFGYRRDEVVGRPLSILLPERLSSDHERQVADFFQNPRLRPMGLDLDLTGRRKDGTEFPAEISLSGGLEGWMVGRMEDWPAPASNLPAKVVLAFITDITTRKQAEQALKERNAELDAFARMVAHDLKSGLATLTGYSEVLLDMEGGLSPEELHQHLQAMAHSGRKLSRVVDDLLLFATLSRKDVEPTRLDMASIVNEALGRLHDLIEDCRAEIILPDSFPAALGYAPWVEEVWFNYISNALKYGGRPPRVEIGSARLPALTPHPLSPSWERGPRTEGEGDSIKFWVRDNGAGLTEEQQAQLFTSHGSLPGGARPGRKNTELGQRQSWGLGLSIVQSIVRKLSGQVGVESRVGEGSTFSFTLPTTDEKRQGDAV
jgi:PAS domain S-box-containing protein